MSKLSIHCHGCNQRSHSQGDVDHRYCRDCGFLNDKGIGYCIIDEPQPGLKDLPIWVVTQGTADFPHGQWVARLSDKTGPTLNHIVEPDYREIRRAMERKGLTKMMPDAEDNPVIKEVWI